MSRVGKIPVVVPKDIKVSVQKSSVLVEGAKGKLSIAIPYGIKVESKDSKLIVTRTTDSKQNRSSHGTLRALLKNSMVGVSQGHKKNLQVLGVGYRVALKGQDLELSLGFSHPVVYKIPVEVKVKAAKPTEIEIEGVDKSLVGEVAAKIRALKPPEPYKGKGIRYEGEIVRKKQGKSVTK